MKAFDAIDLISLTPLHDGVIVSDMIFSERYTSAGIFIPSDDKLVQGVRPRWGKVYSIGPDQKDVTVGQWVCIEHGRWTRGAKIRDANGEHTVRRIDPKDILLVSDEPVIDEIMGRPM